MGLANADPTSLTNRLRSTVFETDETLETTWNNGVLKSFSQWASTDPEIPKPNNSYTESWYAGWLEQSRRLNQLVVDQIMEERQQVEQQRAQDAQVVQQAQREGDGARKDGSEFLEDRDDDRRKKPGSGNNDGENDVEMQGGRRKKKTRKRRKNTRRRKKMKGGKKTKNKRKKKNKSKTRRKRGSGGASCKKTKDCSDGKKCLPGGTQNLEGVDGECVSKPEFISHMKDRGQKKRDERAAEKKEREQEQEVDLSSLHPETNEDREIKKSTEDDLKFDLSEIKLRNGLKIKGL